MSPSEKQTRQVMATTRGMPATDGAGVRMTRVIGTPEFDHIDPFLLFDVFATENPNDYIAGFPPHPHRGFETVTYMLAGQMRHKDNAGNEGVIGPGSVQWMTAGRGIVHSEMPEQKDGLMWGTQLWVNLPADQKMSAPAYQEYADAEIPVEKRADGQTKVIAGQTTAGTIGVIGGRAVDPVYFDVTLQAAAEFDEELPEDHQAFVFVLNGAVQIAAESVTQGMMAILGKGRRLLLTAAGDGARFLLIGGREIREPVARRGPFVMNTSEEVRQAFTDYQTGNF